MSEKTYHIDGMNPASTFLPKSTKEVVEIVLSALGAQTAIVPIGGANSLHVGNSLRSSEWIALDTKGLTETFEFSPEDMVVTVAAGVKFADLQSELRKNGQFLPFDPPNAESATVGGIIACNATGSWQPEFGTPRDRLLGLTVVTANGSVIKPGGKVVKNVAGYDLCKLFTGSYGSLGVITEATFKTNPIPKKILKAMFTAQAVDDAVQAAYSVYRNQLEPAGLSVRIGQGINVEVTIMGSEELADWHLNAITEIMNQNGLVETKENTSAGINNFDQLDDAVSCIASVKQSDCAELVTRLAPSCDLLLVNVPNGMVSAAIKPELVDEFGVDIIDRIQALLPDSAALTWNSVPAEWKQHFDVWGSPRQEWKIMNALKTKLDPNGIFSPGRFVGGI